MPSAVDHSLCGQYFSDRALTSITCSRSSCCSRRGHSKGWMLSPLSQQLHCAVVQWQLHVQVLADSAVQAHPAFSELAEAVSGERTSSELDELHEDALALQSPSGSPRKDGFSRTGGKVRARPLSCGRAVCGCSKSALQHRLSACPACRLRLVWLYVSL